MQAVITLTLRFGRHGFASGEYVRHIVLYLCIRIIIEECIEALHFLYLFPGLVISRYRLQVQIFNFNFRGSVNILQEGIKIVFLRDRRFLVDLKIFGNIGERIVFTSK